MEAEMKTLQEQYIAEKLQGNLLEQHHVACWQDMQKLHQTLDQQPKARVEHI